MKTLSRSMMICCIAIIIPLEGMRDDNEGNDQKKRKI